MKRWVIPFLAVAFLSLPGCQYENDNIPGHPLASLVPNDDTLFKGKQSWETKRHADDWVGPLVDGTMSLGVGLVLAYLSQCDADSPTPPACYSACPGR